MSIKTSADEWVRKGPTQALAVIAALGLVVGGVIGLGVGFKVQQSRTKDDVKELRQQLKAKAASTKPTVGALGQRIGTVTASAPGSITVTTKQRGEVKLVTTDATVYHRAVRGTIADVHSGLRVLVTVGGKEIIVLPAESKSGRVVTGITSDSIKIAKGNGAPAATIKTADVGLVSKVETAKATDIETDDDVYATGRGATAAKTFNTIEVVVLPADSGFVS